MGGEEVWLSGIRFNCERLVITEAENVEVVIVEAKIVILILISGARRCEEIHVTSTQWRQEIAMDSDGGVFSRGLHGHHRNHGHYKMFAGA